MSSLSLYPIKNLNDLFVPYGSFFESNILLASMSYILKYLFCFYKIYFCYLFVSKIYVLCTHSYTWPKKVKKKIIIFYSRSK